MCRKNQLTACCLLTLGIGILIGSNIETVFWSSLLGFGGIALGLLLLLKMQA